MTRLHRTGFFVALVLVGLLTACALDSGFPSGDEQGYQKCETDSDCDEGICLEREPFNFCGAQCTINDDCKPLECGTGFVMACTPQWRCVATEREIPPTTDCGPTEDGDDADGDEPDGDDADGDATDGDDADGDDADGDATDGDATDGDATDGDEA